MKASMPLRLAALLALSLPTLACGQLSQADRDAGWRLLFDGATLKGWRQYRADTMPSGWFIKDGALTKTAATRDIMTVDQYGDFELTFDWRLTTGGNAGVFYRATEEYDHVYWSGPEYQLLDDANAPDGRSRLSSAGALMSVYPSPAGVVKPAGEWNAARLVVHGQHVEHWLNGTKVVDYELWSDDWKAKVAASKFRVWPNYGMAKRGYIAFQGDHSGELNLRNIRIREIK